MPTGYTADIAKGITFEQFALSCARAFGALVEMRDDPKDAPIPKELKASDYNAKEAAKAIEEMRQIQSITPEACEAKAVKEYNEAIAYHKKAIKEQQDLKEKYEAMLIKAKAYQPPTKDHEGIKEFMVSQIEESIAWDCDNKDYHLKAIRNTTKQTGNQWRVNKLAELKQRAQTNQTAQDAENDRVKSRNKWLRDLRASIATVNNL